MKIGDRAISPAMDPYVIAEIGVNHDGDVGVAVELTRAAAAAGASAVKLQLFRADLLMSRVSALASYQAAAGETDAAAMLRRLELPAAAMRPVVEEAHRRGIHAIVTVFSLPLVADAEAVGFDAYKSASPDLINKPLLTAMAGTGRPLIVSTGAGTIEEVARAAGWLRKHAGRTAFLQCVSSYPTPDEDAELDGIEAIADVFAGPVGYSDHTAGVDMGAAAVRRGACILEKHLTHSRAARGPDHAASLEPDQLARYIENARAAAQKLRARIRPLPARATPPRKRVLAIEMDVRRLSRQSLVPARDLPAGHTLRREDLAIKRPGTGLEPWMLEATLGRRLRRPLTADTPLTGDDLVGWAGSPSRDAA
jgi:N-acetylneuraminate synthase/N,N'-diacetyllegionaminate synthase